MKKLLNNRILLIFFLVFLIFCIIFSTQYFVKMKFEQIAIYTDSNSITYNQIKDLANEYNKKDFINAKVYSYSGEKIKKNKKEYISITYVFKIKNNSLIEDFSVNSEIEVLKKYRKNILFYDSPFNGGIYKRDVNSYSVVVYACIKNMDQKEINNLIRNIKIKIYLKGDLFKRKQKNCISFSETKIIKE